jgi:arylsulfatase A-like enzyme
VGPVDTSISHVGRSAFITGQATLRTGLSKVGLPGATAGLQARDATLAELLKPLGYATGKFGKNHLDDRNEYLPTVHGFDEFFGNLYHLNAEEDPENRFYPSDPAVRQAMGPRGVLRCKASDRDDSTEQPRFGRVGKQTIEDTGPLTRKRMETIDDETSDAAVDFIKRQVAANSFSALDLVYVMTNGGPGHATELLITYIYKQAFNATRFDYAAALTVAQFALLLLLTWIAHRAVGGNAGAIE